MFLLSSAKEKKSLPKFSETIKFQPQKQQSLYSRFAINSSVECYLLNNETQWMN
jgi:hypothetical protein